MQRTKIEDWLQKQLNLWCVYEYTFFVQENSSALSLFEREILLGGLDEAGEFKKVERYN